MKGEKIVHGLGGSESANTDVEERRVDRRMAREVERMAFSGIDGLIGARAVADGAGSG